MVGLLSRCDNWGDQDCHLEVKQWFHSPQMANGEELPIKSAWKGMEELDAICKGCENRLFEAKNLTCFMCGGSLHKIPTWLEYRGEEAHGYKCPDCNTPYFSTSELT